MVGSEVEGLSSVSFCGCSGKRYFYCSHAIQSQRIGQRPSMSCGELWDTEPGWQAELPNISNKNTMLPARPQLTCATQRLAARSAGRARKQPEVAANLRHTEPGRPAGLPNTSNRNAMPPTSAQLTCATQKPAEPGDPAWLPNNPNLQPTYGTLSPTGRPGSQTLQT